MDQVRELELPFNPLKSVETCSKLIIYTAEKQFQFY